ncbi:hypothetical protein H4582DRAFT_2126650 [Lactarius indigo]|nr:hypothetical protein H4582DRAFT_2126650 [Lactarius indigo]
MTVQHKVFNASAAMVEHARAREGGKEVGLTTQFRAALEAFGLSRSLVACLGISLMWNCSPVLHDVRRASGYSIRVIWAVDTHEREDAKKRQPAYWRRRVLRGPGRFCVPRDSPTYSTLSDSDVDFVSNSINKAMASFGDSNQRPAAQGWAAGLMTMGGDAITATVFHCYRLFAWDVVPEGGAVSVDSRTFSDSANSGMLQMSSRCSH